VTVLFKPSTHDSNAVDVQTAPVVLAGAGNMQPNAIKVDVACLMGDTLVVAGWCPPSISLDLESGNGPLDTIRHATSRADVSRHFQLRSAKNLGFVLVAAFDGCSPVRLKWQEEEGKQRSSLDLLLALAEALEPAHYTLIGETVCRIANNSPAHSRQWLDLLPHIPTTDKPCRHASGYLDFAAANVANGESLVVGWVASMRDRDSAIWLEDDMGNVYSIATAYRWSRPDVRNSLGNDVDFDTGNAGFMVGLKGLMPGSSLRLRVLSEEGAHVLHAIECKPLPADPAAIARHLFGVRTPQSAFAERVRQLDAPLLEPFIRRRQEMFQSLPVETKQLGSPLAHPRVTIIIPIYGRIDFMEHQFIEFSRDAWLREHAELIYVLDDPGVAEAFKSQAVFLYNLYGLAFSWVWGGANRGFSGANNLGAQFARGGVLLFLNSDVIPLEPGWLQALVDILDGHPEVAAVGPRLLFADGSIQHCGMTFEWHEELGVWINHHPCQGLDPILDPHASLTCVPAITGACLALRREEFERVGGWDSGYLIGDFEDSDLCLKLHSEGLQIAYLPSVQLTHLERQSFRMIGNDDFRTRVLVYNAVRHQDRWPSIFGSGEKPGQPGCEVNR